MVVPAAITGQREVSSDGTKRPWGPTGVPPPETLYLASCPVSFEISINPPNQSLLPAKPARGKLLDRSTLTFHDLEFLGNLFSSLGSDGDLVPARRKPVGRQAQDKPLSTDRESFFLQKDSSFTGTNHHIERFCVPQAVRVDLNLDPTDSPGDLELGSFFRAPRGQEGQGQNGGGHGRLFSCCAPFRVGAWLFLRQRWHYRRGGLRRWRRSRCSRFRDRR